MNNANQASQVFWNGRTAYLNTGPFEGIVKVHEISQGMVTFTVILNEKKRDDDVGREDRRFYQPGLTFTVPFSGQRMVLRTLDEEQKMALSTLTPVVEVGEGVGLNIRSKII